MGEIADLQQVDAVLPQLLRKTGAFVLNEFKHFDFGRIEYKGENDLFSYVDVTAEDILKKSCKEVIPNSGFITEESANENTQRDFIWVIDPVDGTTNFTHGLPIFCISLGLTYKSEMVRGYIYHPASDELFVAKKGEGAFLNGEKIQVSPKVDLKEALLSTRFPGIDVPGKEVYAQMLANIIGESHGVRRLGSAALEMAYVACGRLDGYFEFGLKPWDVAAASLLVQEAGGKVTDMEGGPNYFFGKQILVSNGPIHATLLGHLQSWVSNLKSVQ
ncbi:MAG: inositol monophosphatase family protein [Bacteroidota bacterium]